MSVYCVLYCELMIMTFMESLPFTYRQLSSRQVFMDLLLCFPNNREDEPRQPKKPSVMNSKDRTASPARKPSLALRTAKHETGCGPPSLPTVPRPASEFCPPHPSMDSLDPTDEADNKTTLKIHLVDGGFNVVRCSDTTDIKVSTHLKFFKHVWNILIDFPVLR